MASLTLSMSDRLTAAEMVKRNEIDDEQRQIIELMSETNEILLDAPYVRANDGTTNTQIVRTALPTVSRRHYNKGVGTSASQTDLMHDVCEQLAIYSKVDVSLIKNQKNPEQALTQEQVSFLEAMGQQQAEDILYGNHDTDKDQTNGFAPRRGKLVTGLCEDALATHTSNKQTSIYMVKWGPQNCKLIYPKEAAGIGVSRTDKGIQTVEDGNGGEFEAYVNYYQCDFGVSVGNNKSLIRLANIDMNDALSDDECKTIVKKILALSHKLPAGAGTVSLLCNADIFAAFDQATVERNNVLYSTQDPWGRPIVMLRDMRIRKCDAILNTEAVIAS